MKPEPHVEFIPFPDPTPVDGADAGSHGIEPSDAGSDLRAADAVPLPDPAGPDRAPDGADGGGPTEAVAPDQVLGPGEEVHVVAEDRPASAAEDARDLDDADPDAPGDAAADAVESGAHASVASDATDATDAPAPGGRAIGDVIDVVDVDAGDLDAGDLDAGDLGVVDGPDAASTTNVVDLREGEADPRTDGEGEADSRTGGEGDGGAPDRGGPASSVAGAAPRVRARAVPPAETPAPPDTSAFRRWGIAGRLLFLPMAGIVVGVAIALVATLGVVTTTAAARQVADSAVASARAAELRVSLAEARDADGPLASGLLDDLGTQTSAVAGAAADQVPSGRLDGLAAAVDRLVSASRGGAGPVEVEGHAVTALGLLDALVARVEATRLHRLAVLEGRRDRTILVILVVLLVGAAAMLALDRVIGQSIVGPIRLLGRAMRRFADGDTAARGVEGVDEVGLLARSFNYSAAAMGRRIDRLSADAARGTQLRMISDALDLADDQDDVHRIAERALGIVAPGRPGQILVTRSTSNRLVEIASNPQFPSPGCPVEVPADCVAMRRAQPVVFDSPTAINACPRLRGRESDCAAACVPVSVNGHLLGVVHVTGPEHDPPTPEAVEQLVTLAGQVGNRIGAMRTLEVTRLQASTDGLTGLANRRMLEARLDDLMRSGTPYVLAVADLDRFTQINNTYGHEFGDKALQLFAGVLEENVRDRDVVARFGGEEFVLVYPDMSVKPSMEAIERIRAALARAIARNDFPEFTCSFGVTHSSVGDSVEDIIRIADAGLLTAKELGRNRVVYADEDMAAEVFGGSNDGLAATRAFSSMRRIRATGPDPTPDPG